MQLDVLVGKAKRLQPQQMQNYFVLLQQLLTQFRSGVALRGPYRLLLDSNVVMSLETYHEEENPSEGLLAVLTFFAYLQRSSFQWDLLIRPSVFYEYIRRGGVADLKDHWEKFQGLCSLVEDTLEVEPLFEGTETYERAAYHIGLIEHDVRVISAYLETLPRRDWTLALAGRVDAMDEPRPRGVRALLKILRSFGRRSQPVPPGTSIWSEGTWAEPPRFAAEPLYEGLDLRYFDDRYVGRCIKSHIAWHISQDRANARWVVKRFGEKEDYRPKKLLRLRGKNNTLKGLGDVDLLSLGNIRNQFWRQAHKSYRPASVPLTLEKDLFFVLLDMSDYSVSSLEMGEDSDNTRAKLEIYQEDLKRISKAEDRQKRCAREQQAFMQELSDL